MADLFNGLRTFVRWTQANKASATRTGRVDTGELSRRLIHLRANFGDLAAALNKDGVVSIPDYWSSDRCDSARTELDRLIGDFPESVQSHSGGADKRMYGVESASVALAEFHEDPFPRNFGEMMCGLSLYNFATLGAHIVAAATNRGSGDGWHRDAHGFQFKSILYLVDTTPENGPFEYIQGSHKGWRVGLDTAFGDLPGYPNTRFTDAQIENLSNRFPGRRKSFPAKAGTLLLVNTSGIHRGRPLEKGQRYALTNYYYHPSDIDEGRIVQFSPLVPGTAQRIRRDISAS